MQPYFSHDIFTRENLKIKRLVATHKMEGYGVFWAVVEFLHNNNNKLLLSEIDIIAADLGVDVKLVESVVKNFKLFSIRNKVISSSRVAQNIKLKNEKSEKAKKAAMQRWQDNSTDADALLPQCECNAIKESKVNESKEKEIKEKEIKEKEIKEKEIKEKEIKEKEIKEKEKEIKEKEIKENKKNESKEIKENENTKNKKNENKANQTALKQENSTEIKAEKQNSMQNEQSIIKNFAAQFSDNRQNSNFHGTSTNVHLTPEQYNSLSQLYGKDIVDTVILELSHKIATGKEQAYNAEFPNAHLARLERYARQKIATTGTAGRANVNLTRNTSPAGAAEPRKAECEALKLAREIVEGGGVPPPPEFHEAGKRLRKELKGDNS